MGHSGKVVISIRFIQAEMSRSLSGQRDVVITLGCVTDQQAFFLFQIFKGADDVGVCVRIRAVEKLLSKNARPLVSLKKDQYVFLDLAQTAFLHVFTPAQIMPRMKSDNTVPQRPNCSKLVGLTAPPKGDAMKNFLVVCLIFSLATLGSAYAPTPESFMPAEQFVYPQRTFFRWSTSAGGYLLRHDGVGEFTPPPHVRTVARRIFYVGMSPKDRLVRVYYLEHDRDLFLLYEVRDHGFYLVRIEQKEQVKRNLKWVTALGNLSGEDPSMDGNVVRIGKSIEISAADGRVLRRD